MINALFFGINIFLIYAVWVYYLKPAILDHYRDKLFDLREEVREFYLSNGIPLSDKTYKSLRDLINGYLHSTESISITKIIAFSIGMENNKKLNARSKHQIDARFKTNNENLREYIDSVRVKSNEIILEYVTYSTPIMCFAWVLLGKLLRTKIATQDKLEDYSFGNFSHA